MINFPVTNDKICLISRQPVGLALRQSAPMYDGKLQFTWSKGHMVLHSYLSVGWYVWISSMPSTNLACKKFDEIKKKHFTPFNQELKHVQSFQHLINSWWFRTPNHQLRFAKFSSHFFTKIFYNKFPGGWWLVIFSPNFFGFPTIPNPVYQRGLPTFSPRGKAPPRHWLRCATWPAPFPVVKGDPPWN